MKKILCMILALVLCAAMLAGCGSGNASKGNQSSDNPSSDNQGSTGGAGKTEAPASGMSSGPVQITEAYAFADPADLDFDARYVLYLGPENQAVAMSASSGLAEQYMILYAKEEKILASYNLSIYDTAESAQTAAEAMAATGTAMAPAEEDGAVIYSLSDGAAMELVMASLSEAGLLPDTNASSFANFQVEMNGAVLLG